MQHSLCRFDAAFQLADLVGEQFVLRHERAVVRREQGDQLSASGTAAGDQLAIV